MLTGKQVYETYRLAQNEIANTGKRRGVMQRERRKWETLKEWERRIYNKMADTLILDIGLMADDDDVFHHEDGETR
jgi:hypothetical protein